MKVAAKIFLWKESDVLRKDVFLNLPALLVALIIFTLSVTVLGCSYVEYKGNPDGSTTITGWEFGTSTALNGAEISISKEGTRSMKLSGLDADRVEGLKQVNQGLGLIIEGAVKGAK